MTQMRFSRGARNGLAIGLLAIALAACGPQPANTALPAATPAPSPPGASETSDALVEAPQSIDWTGRWTGPEGTYLDVVADGSGAYTLEIANLDGPRRFPARLAGDHLEFERDGQALTLRATDGPGTGMKWLQDKVDCVVVAVGEGFCR